MTPADHAGRPPPARADARRACRGHGSAERGGLAGGPGSAGQAEARLTPSIVPVRPTLSAPGVRGSRPLPEAPVEAPLSGVHADDDEEAAQMTERTAAPPGGPGPQPGDGAGPGHRGGRDGGRPLGRARRQERRRRRGGRRDAPAHRHRLDARRRRDRRGREGRGAHAVQRRGGRQRRGPGLRRRRRPDRRHHADGQGHAERAGRARGRRARRDVRPVGRVLHGEAGRRPGGGRRHRHHRAGRGEHPPGRQGQGHRGRRRHRLRAGPAAARDAGQGDPPDRARASTSSPTATSPARSPRPARTPASTCSSASAAPRRGSSPRRRSSAWAARSRAGCGRTTTRSGPRRSTPGHDLDQVLTTDELVRGDNVFFCATGRHRRRPAARRALPGRAAAPRSRS